jgi:hypothetical protein
MTDGMDLAKVRAIIVDDERRLALMRRNGVDSERTSSLGAEIDAWKRRLHNLEAAAAAQ